MAFRKTPDGLVIGPNKSLTAEDQKLLLLIYQMKGHHNAGLTIGQVWRTFSERSKKSLRNQLRTLDSKGVIFYSKN